MLEMKITITAQDLTQAINNLASVLNGNQRMPAPKEEVSVTFAPTAQTGTPPTVPQSTTLGDTASGTTNAVPTAAPQYTLDMIATAGSALIDAGKMEQLIELLAKFGVSSLTELAPSNYGAVATELRTLGAAL